ncbi:hypothetical protein OKA04_23275 [Luteolibacter flavescens]|uniref:Uncharacterized protein n=1 Tax=Luteolibacter flavescens TaxID=1859460 RepID=A0ABT3FVU6_9BACT|nr:hypothetical protein [Luteolibacter flavescens]MCW1887678.1 hypothetical protein [Luteolibacter flavescens]
MEKVISDYLEMVSGMATVGDREISLGRVVLHVLPRVDADPPERLFMEIPGDLRPQEALAPMALKAALVGHEGLPAFLHELKAALAAGKEYRHQAGKWRVTCSEKGSMLSIEARYRP